MDISKDTFVSILERMATYGTAPEEGCSVFGVGYENVFLKLKNKYLIEQFRRGMSSEKFVVGPFGSGKTHFLRHFMEIARDMDCVTAEVILNKDIDFTKSLIVYGEIVRGIRTPLYREHGIQTLLQAALDKACSPISDSSMKDMIVHAWIKGLDKIDFKYKTFGVVVKKALLAKLNEDDVVFDSCCRWLEGDINDRSLAKELNVPKIDAGSNNLYAKNMMLSLFQFIRHAGFNGTVVCFDEAEQGLSVDKKKTEKILSMLQAGINAIADLQNGSAMLMYAFTPDLVEKMKSFAALQQRIWSPSGRSFADGNVLAPLIDLTIRDPLQDLRNIGRKLVSVFFDKFGGEVQTSKDKLFAYVDKIASDILEKEISSSNRRDMVKNVCSFLLEVLETEQIYAAATADDSDIYEAEV
ncbi:MAG TPA: DUF2791 family P-loop domain-containing protein [Clostridiales bacterium]|nr:DUF2791 family P-loop domain-containing protein [Clostridiales bacterium]